MAEGGRRTNVKPFMSAVRTYLMAPRLARLARSVPKNRTVAWERYWAGLATAWDGGEVLWDAGTDREFLSYRDVLLRHFDPALPVVDVGCGHGAFTRALAGVFPAVIGVDVSRHAVDRAREEQVLLGERAERTGRITYEVRDMTEPGAGGGLLGGSGHVGQTGANVFIRGLLHVLRPGDQAELVENLRLLAGPGALSFWWRRTSGAAPSRMPPTSVRQPGVFLPRSNGPSAGCRCRAISVRRNAHGSFHLQCGNCSKTGRLSSKPTL